VRGEPVRILLIAELSSGGAEIPSLLASADAVRAHLETVDAAALDAQRAGEGGSAVAARGSQSDLSGYDAIVLDGGGGGGRLLERVRHVRRIVPTTPLVVLTDDDTVGAQVVSLGAQDSLVRRDLDLAVLMRALRHAIQRQSVTSGAAAGDREVRALERMARSSRSVSAAAYGAGSLEGTDVYPDLEDRYQRAVEAALDEQVYEGVEPRSPGLIRELGAYLGVLRAHPRDAVRLHLDVVRALGGSGGGGRPSAAYLNVGRLVLLEVLGHLAAYYRNYAWGPPSPPDGAGAGTGQGAGRQNGSGVHQDADGEGRA
jgi:hypothetical protein